MNEDTRDESLLPIVDAVRKVKDVLDGMYVHEQIAVLAQVTGFVLMNVEQKDKFAGENARKVFASMLRNVCFQWRLEFRQHKK